MTIAPIGPLFDPPRRPAPPKPPPPAPPEDRLARRTDPDTSRQAIRQLERSGRRRTQDELVLKAVRDRPDRTAAELAEVIGILDHVQTQRCLSRLKNVGVVRMGAKRRSSTNGAMMVTWRLDTGGLR